MDRRQLFQVTAAGVAAAVIPGAAKAKGNPVVLVDLPFVQSCLPYFEEQLSGGFYLGHYYSLIPRTSQLQNAVDASLASFRDQLVSLDLTLLDARGEAIGPSCRYEDAFLRGTALGWFGAGATLKTAGLFKQEAALGLDRISKVRVEVVPFTGPLVGEVRNQRRLHDEALQEEGGKVTIFGDGSFLAGGMDADSYYTVMSHLQIIKVDPRYTFFTSHRVWNASEAYKGRIVSMPGATARELAEAREIYARGDTLVWRKEVRFC